MAENIYPPVLTVLFLGCILALSYSIYLKGRLVSINQENCQLKEQMFRLEVEKKGHENNSLRDHLTGLYNVRGFQEFLKKEISRSERFRHDLSVIFVDLDNFKSVNDRLGHVEGNSVLMIIGEMMESQVREGDIVARYGGDEFSIILPHSDIDAAKFVAEKIRASISEYFSNHSVAVTVSIGVASLESASRDKLIQRADEAMYQSKNLGGNCVTAAK